eukprot:74718_1
MSFGRCSQAALVTIRHTRVELMILPLLWICLSSRISILALNHRKTNPNMNRLNCLIWQKNDADYLAIFEKKTKEAKACWDTFEKTANEISTFAKEKNILSSFPIDKAMAAMQQVGAMLGYAGVAVSYSIAVVHFFVGSSDEQSDTTKIINEIQTQCTKLHNTLRNISNQIQQLSDQLSNDIIDMKYVTDLEKNVTNFRSKYADLLSVMKQKDLDIMQCDFMKSFDNVSVMNTFEENLKYMLSKYEFDRVAKACHDEEIAIVEKTFVCFEYIALSVQYILTYHAIKEFHDMKNENFISKLVKKPKAPLYFARKQQLYAEQCDDFVSRFDKKIYEIRAKQSKFDNIRADIVDQISKGGFGDEKPFTCDYTLKLQTNIWKYLATKYIHYKWIVAVWIPRIITENLISNSFPIYDGLCVTIGRLNERKMPIPWPEQYQTGTKMNVNIRGCGVDS